MARLISASSCGTGERMAKASFGPTDRTPVKAALVSADLKGNSIARRAVPD